MNFSGWHNMKIIFISNYMTHHQYYFCKELQKRTEDFCFVQMQTITQERISLGWTDSFEGVDIKQGIDELPELLKACDAVILGGVPNKILNIIRKSVSQNCILYVYSESLFKKNKFQKYNFLSCLKLRHKYANLSRCYLLAASAYAPYDYKRCGLFKNKMYTWGYFPEFFEQPIKHILNRKQLSLLWVGRFLDWKHPGDAIAIVSKLKAKGVPFSLTMIGSGTEKGKILEMVKSLNLEEDVSILEPRPTQEIREYMKEADMLLFTSDRGEGWGVVANEAINSGCLVIGCEEAGSVPLLLQDECGIQYPLKQLDKAVEAIINLYNSPVKANEMVKKAYEKLKQSWTPKIAAERMLLLTEKLHKGETFFFKEGICSRATIVKH